MDLWKRVAHKSYSSTNENGALFIVHKICIFNDVFEYFSARFIEVPKNMYIITTFSNYFWLYEVLRFKTLGLYLKVDLREKKAEFGAKREYSISRELCEPSQGAKY